MKKTDILSFIQSSQTPVTKREIARAFGIKGGEHRVALKQILKKLVKEESIIKMPGGAFSVPDGLPGVTVLVVNEISVDGDVFAAPDEWDDAALGAAPRIEVMPDKKGHPALATGDRILARLKRVSANMYEARAIKKLDGSRGRILGMIRTHKGGGTLQPVDKKAKNDFKVPQDSLNGAKDGDLVLAEQRRGRGLQNTVKIVEILGRRDDPKAISLISMHESGLRTEFPQKVIDSTKGMKVPPLKGREDLRDIPLVTIDGSDARDFDDAVFAEKTENGYHLIVAIADVAYYVRPYSPLDVEAQARGNSTYFPDRVVPMLPEALSNDLCSLRPRENRACLAVHMWIDGEGHLNKFKFVRGLMRSEARLTYEQVQAAKDGVTDETTEPLMDKVINPLYEVFEILEGARKKRGALDLDLPERRVVIDENGNMTGVVPRVRLNAHKLIEEFMILANVAAAKALEKKGAPCVYRVHDRPSLEKLDSARGFLESFGLSLPKGQTPKPAQINFLLEKAATMPYSHLVSQAILRTQAQAVYAIENIGHFGLALDRYAHFTSPIRRYADLLVHRSLIRFYGLGEGSIDDGEIVRLEEIAGHISQTERASMEAERNSIDRFTANYLSDKIGSEFAGRITGVTRFGLFVELSETGADGLIPMRSLDDDFYVHDETLHALIGRRKGKVYRLGAPVTVRIVEADGLTGSSIFEFVGHENGADIPGMELQRSQLPSGRGDRRGGRGKNKKKGFRKKKKGGEQHSPKSKRKRTTPKHKHKKK